MGMLTLAESQMAASTLNRTIDRVNMIRTLDHVHEQTQEILNASPPDPYSAKWEPHVLGELSRLLSEARMSSLVYGEQLDSKAIKNKAQKLRTIDADRYVMPDNRSLILGLVTIAVFPIGIYLLIRYHWRLRELKEILRENASELSTIRSLVENPLLERSNF